MPGKSANQTPEGPVSPSNLNDGTLPHRSDYRKVLFVAAVDETARQFVAPIADQLRADGVHTTLVVGSQGRTESISGFDRTIRIRDFRRRGPWQLRLAATDLLHIISSVRPDVVHLHTPFGIAVGRLAAKRAQVPAIAVVHGTALGGRWPSDRAYRTAEKFLAPACPTYIVLNTEDAADYRRLAPDASVVLAPCGGAGVAMPFQVRSSHAGRISSDRAQATLRLLYLGRPTPSKGIDVLLEAWARARVDLPELELRVVGLGAAGDRPTRIPQLAGITVIDDFVDPLPELSRADALVTASSREGFGMAVAEALSQGVPVACVTNRGSRFIADRVERGLELTDPNPDSLSQGIARALRSTVRLKDGTEHMWSRSTVVDFHVSQIAAAARW